MEGDNTAGGNGSSPRPQEIPCSIREKAIEIREEIEACPAHASTVPGYISAVAAHVCVATEASLAFCFVKDVETEQFIGAYCVRRPELPEVDEDDDDEFSVKPFRVRLEAEGRARREPEATTRARQAASWPGWRKLTESGVVDDRAGARLPLRSREPGNLSPDVLDFFHSLLLHDAQDSNTCSACTVQYRPIPAAKPTYRVKPRSGQCPEVPPCTGGGIAHEQQKEVRNPLGLGSFLPYANQPALLVLAHDGIVGSLVNDLGEDVQAYTYNYLTDELSRVKEDDPSTKQGTTDDSCSSLFGGEKCGLVGCLLKAEGARSASAAMADARLCYVPPRGPRKSAGFSLGTQRASQSEREIVANRLAPMEPALRSIPETSSTTAPFQGSTAALYSNLFGAPDVTGSAEASSRMRPFSCPAASDPRVLTSPRMRFTIDNSMLPTLAEEQDSSGRSLSSSFSRGSEDLLRKPNVASDLFCGEWNAPSTVGVIFCINPKAPGSRLLVKVLAEVCSASLAVLLQLHWLRRDRCKRLLQLELHRTVFQETTLPIRMMQRFLALLHAAVGAEAAAFFIIDAQNRNYICLGGHRRATGLRLSRNHKLLGEATRHGGQTVLLNYLPPGVNKEYDERANFKTSHVLLIPLLSTQGQVKAVVLLLNKQHCTCTHMLESKVRTDDACMCRQQIRSFTEYSLAVDAWKPSAPPCGNCCRAQEGELTYEDYMTTPSWSLDLDSSSHFIRQGNSGNAADALGPKAVHEVLMRAVQCEMQHFLGGQLTNLCMTGLSLLQPMQTMVSYVMADQQQGGKGAVKPVGAVMTQIENFVLRDKRLKLLSLRRCESVAATEPESPVSGSDAESGRKAFGLFPSRRGSRMQQSATSASAGTAGPCRPSRPAASIPQSLTKDRWAERNQRINDDSEAQHCASRISLPVAIGADCAGRPLPLMHSNSAPLEISLATRDPSKPDLVSSPADVESMDLQEERAALQRRRAASVPAIVFSAALEKCHAPFDAIRKQLSLEPYRRLDLNVWERTAEELELFFFLAVEDLGVMIKSEQARLQRFFGLIRDAYHTDNPYHNFYHAIHVTQMCWLFLTRYSCKNALSHTEQLGLLLAALAHDVDHPGVNNRTLCEEQHPLAIMYNDKAVLENHHAAFAARTMMDVGLFFRSPETREAWAPAGMPFCRGRSTRQFSYSSGLRPDVDQNVPFLESSNYEPFYPEFAKIRRVLISCILATDMELFSHHHEAMRTRTQVKRTTGESFRTDEDRTLLMNCLIHCADISNPLLPERRNVQWASLIVQEFNAQVEMERHKGLPITTFMDQRTELMRTQSQIGFLSFVVLDQFRALADLVPGVDELIAQGERNLEEWQQALDVLREAERRDMHKQSLRSLEIPRNFTFRLKDLTFQGMNGPKCFGRLRSVGRCVGRCCCSDEVDGWRPQALDE
ncbi:hypothetical protein Esti_003764 [Eimeria stiedai]